MDGFNLNQFYCILTLFILSLKGSLAQISIELTTPVNPVEQDGILSIHCQVSRTISEQHEVTILRTTKNNNEKLSVDEGVLQGVDDRVFLAVRKLADGSTVYFLSITDVQRSDEGDYFCKVLTKGGTIKELASKKVPVGVTYYPDDSQPECSPDVHKPLHAGSTLVLNCSSDEGNPVVSLDWGSSVREQLGDTQEIIKNNKKVFSVLTLTIQNDDDGAVFLCQMTSTQFPEEIRTCHVGPLKVIKNPNMPTDTLTDSSNTNAKNELTTVGLDTNKDTSGGDIIRHFTPSQCEDICPASSRVMYWMVATVIAAALSIIFFIAAIALLVKYLHAPSVHRSHYVAARPTPEDIYSELECRRLGEGKVYMSLDKSAIKPTDVDTSAQYGIHYHEMPGVMKVAAPSN